MRPCASLFAALVLSAPPAVYVPDLPTGSRPYDGDAGHTQAVSVHNSFDTIERVKTKDPEWLVPGGMEGLSGWTAKRFRRLPSPPAYRTEGVPVENSLGEKQTNRALLRSYPDGTRFDEVLLNAKTGLVFEHRVREKKSGKWSSRVEYRDASQRPAGYKGLRRSCSSCHDKTATGKYAEGLVPGGDTVFSDPVDFSALKAYPAVQYFDPYPVRK